MKAPSIIIIFLVSLNFTYSQELEYYNFNDIPLLFSCNLQKLQVVIEPEYPFSENGEDHFTIVKIDGELNDISVETKNNLLVYTPNADDPAIFSFELKENFTDKTRKVFISNIHCDDSNYNIFESNVTKISKENFVVSSEKIVDSVEVLNYDQPKLINLYIAGIDLDFTDVETDILGKYNGQKDIHRIYIRGRNVTFNGQFRFPHSSLSIRCKTLKFIDDSADNRSFIDITPISYEQRPLKNANGVEGLSARTSWIRYNKFLNNESNLNIRFIANGGNGQPAGFGSNGVSKNSNDIARPIWQGKVENGHWVFPKNNNKKWLIPINKHPNIIYFNYRTTIYHRGIGPNDDDWTREKRHRWGSPNFPVGGGDATKPGRPGSPGRGGNFYGPAGIERIVKNNPGKAGEMAKDVSGGEPQQPSTYTYIENGLHTVTVHKGKSFKAPKPKQAGSLRGTFYIGNKDKKANNVNLNYVVENGNKHYLKYTKAWFSFELLQMELKHLDFLYYSGQYRATLFYANQYLTDLIQIDRLSYTSRQITKFDTYANKFRSIINQINNQLDYYGNPIDWVPNLTFEVNLDIYDSEVETAISSLIHIYRLKNVINNQEKQINRLSALRDNSRLSINNLISEFNDASTRLPNLETKIDSINFLTKDLNQSLKKIELEIQKMAEDNLKPKSWKKTLSKISTIMKAVPVYQPTLATTGLAIDAVVEYDENKIGGVLNKMPSYYEIYDQSKDYKKNIDLFVESVKKTDWTDKQSIKNNRKSIKNRAKVLADYYDKIDNGYKEQRIPLSKIDEEIERIKATHPIYNSIVKKLKTLTRLKSETLVILHSVNAKIGQIPIQIEENINNINEINTYISNSSNYNISTIGSTLTSIELSSLKRLRKYQYYLKKSYEYRFLKAYPVDLSLDFIEKEIIKVSEREGNTDLKILESVNLVYEQKLQQVNESLVDLYNNNQTRVENTLPRHLKSSEMESLLGNGFVEIPLNKELLTVLKNEENLRIIDIDIQMEISDDNIDLSDVAYANLEFAVEHNGISYLEKDGRINRFNHSNNIGQFLGWKKKFDLRLKSPSKATVSARDKSLLLKLSELNTLDKDDHLGYMLFNAYPGMLTTLRLYLTKQFDEEISIERLTLLIKYEYENKLNNQIRLIIDSNINELNPRYVITPSDNNGKLNGGGTVYRFYSKNTPIQIEAEGFIGKYKFSHFNLDGKIVESNPLLINLNSNKELEVIYLESD